MLDLLAGTAVEASLRQINVSKMKVFIESRAERFDLLPCTINQDIVNEGSLSGFHLYPLFLFCRLPY